jgi:protein O-mannosyl-transferase
MLLLGDTRIRTASAANAALIIQHTYWWPNGESGLYRPLTTLSYLLNYSILGNGDRPAGYHWINFFPHTANVFLLFALALRAPSSFRTISDWAARVTRPWRKR